MTTDDDRDLSYTHAAYGLAEIYWRELQGREPVPLEVEVMRRAVKEFTEAQPQTVATALLDARFESNEFAHSHEIHYADKAQNTIMRLRYDNGPGSHVVMSPVGGAVMWAPWRVTASALDARAWIVCFVPGYQRK